MIVQTAPEGEPHFVSTMVEHMDLCGQMARAFGNEQFEPLDPFEQVLYVIENHDRGWDIYDANPGIDPNTRLPYLMARTPTPDAIKTNKGSPDHNESHHPYCGLLSSMHSWGLYNRRYGFSQFVVRTRNTVSIPVANDHRVQIQTMLAAEVERQGRLKQVLAAAPATRHLADEKQIMKNYKQLQFFDTLALFFQLYHAQERGDEVFIHVPKNAEADATIKLNKVNERTYSLDPFPFKSDALELVCRGRYAYPFPPDRLPADVGPVLYALPTQAQTYQIVRRH
jgi:hypothetical protein